jgi:hypothetical protein
VVRQFVPSDVRIANHSITHPSPNHNQKPFFFFPFRWNCYLVSFEWLFISFEMMFSMFTLLALAISTLAVHVDVLSKRQSTRCGTAKIDLTSLKSAKDYVMPIGIPCSLPQCGQGLLPWNIFFNLCQPVQTNGPFTNNCGGAQACQQWTGDSASLGQFNTVNYTDIQNGVLLTATGGSSVDGVSRQMFLQILCANVSDPYPTIISDDSTTLTYTFSWNRVEVCTARPPCNGKLCLDAIRNCISAVGPASACLCFSNAATCFQNCSSSDVALLKAEAECLRNGCGSSICNF